MISHSAQFSKSVVTVVAIAITGLGFVWQSPTLLGSGAIIFCVVLLSFESRVQRMLRMKKINHRVLENAKKKAEQSWRGDQQLNSEPNKSEAWEQENLGSGSGWEASDPLNSTDDLVDQMVHQNRYALLLRPEAAKHLRRDQIKQVILKLDEKMALVPAGKVLTEEPFCVQHIYEERSNLDIELCSEVEGIYLDRYQVSNKEYRQFVQEGGYEQLEFWAEESLPVLLDFVDQSGTPGPKFWEDGRYPEGEGNLPVVGVSWYEARAYARWCGKRLPSSEEWTKAAAWPIESDPGEFSQRRYPWGDTFDQQLVNTWSSQLHRPVAVDAYADGVSVSGLNQMVGNVWEWVEGSVNSPNNQTVYTPTSLKGLRGGAFNTYFENQTTASYQSGDEPLTRKNNIGIRLALPLSCFEETVNSKIEKKLAENKNSSPEEAETNEAATPVVSLV